METPDYSPGVTVVIPAYRSAQTLPQLVERLEPVLRATNQPFELIIVNDGSADDTWRVIEELAVAHDWIRGIDMMRNFGQHNALLCGIRRAGHATVVTMDDDLQNRPEEIPKLLSKLDDDQLDVVYGAPTTRRHGLARNLASTITKIALQRAMGAETARHISAFRALRTQLRDAAAGYLGPTVSIDVVLTWGTTRFGVVFVEHDERQHGKSNYGFGLLMSHALNMLTGFTTLPLRLASWIGFGFTLLGFGVLAWVLGRYMLQGTPVQGFPFLASIIAVFSGAQLFALGIIGEYLARMHLRIMNRPSYVVRREATA